MKKISRLLLSFAFALPAYAGDLSTAPMTPAPEPAPSLSYEGGRGLLTTEGPSGLFMNPTSATLPKGAFTAQYCFFLPENDSNPWAHGFMSAYGITDWAEFGAIGLYVDAPGENPFAIGPFGRIRLLKDEAILPQLSIGGYARFGDDAAESRGAFVAAYKRIAIQEDGFVKALGLHAGLRQNWAIGAGDDPFRGYGGLEIQLPYRLYLVGEVSSRDGEKETPYSFGVQWRAGGINISVAGIQNGNLPDPGFFFGIGSQLSF